MRCDLKRLLSKMLFVQVVRGCPGGRFQFSRSRFEDGSVTKQYNTEYGVPDAGEPVCDESEGCHQQQQHGGTVLGVAVQLACYAHQSQQPRRLQQPDQRRRLSCRTRSTCNMKLVEMSSTSHRRHQTHRCKKNFLRFYLVTFLRFLFSKRFFIFQNVDKVQSGKQINKKHFQNNSNEIDV